LWLSVVLVALAVLPLRWLGPAWFGSRQELQFRNVRDLATWAEARGLHCRSDTEDGRVTNGVAVSRRPLTLKQVARLYKASPERGPQWEGVIWASNYGSVLKAMLTPPWEGECRVWGGVLVTGDPALLDALERGEW
jgi:hypothetical protein